MNCREEVVAGIFLVLADSLLLKRVDPLSGNSRRNSSGIVIATNQSMRSNAARA